MRRLFSKNAGLKGGIRLRKTSQGEIIPDLSIPSTRLLYPATNSNLVSNSNFDGSTGFALNNNAALDTNVSRLADGSDSVEITQYSPTKAELTTGIISVTTDAIYTVSIFSKAMLPKSVMQIIVTPYDINSVAMTNLNGRRYTYKNTTDWQEEVIIFRVPKDVLQIETATIAGTITGSGDIAITVTASGLTGSPKTINVAVVNGDSASSVAGKVRTALAADSDIAAIFTVSGATTQVILTKKVAAATDTTLNIASATGTATGLTAAPTSSNTSAGGDAKRVRLRFQRERGEPTQDSTGKIWLDDIDFRLGRFFRSDTPTNKTAFNGGKVKIDGQGNLSVNVGGVWKDIFPYGIYQNTNIDYSLYANNGFNCVLFGQLSTSAGAEAKSTTHPVYAPNGMFFFSEIAQYFDARFGLYKNYSNFDSTLATLLAHNCASHFLGCYADIETYISNVDNDVLDVPETVFDRFRLQDTDRIIYANTGSDGQSIYFKDKINWVGSYISNDSDVCLILNNLPVFSAPLGMGIISITNSAFNIVMTAEQFRRDAYKALIVGCRGISVYKDAASPNNIDNASFSSLFSTMKDIADEIQIMFYQKGFLKGHLSGNWSASSSNSNVLIGRRTYQNRVYLIFLNNSAGTVNPTITLIDFPYVATRAEDMLESVANINISNNQFSLSLGAYGTKVVKIM